MNILQVNSVSRSFDGVRALDGLSFDLPDGKITGLIGPNGSGKTTLFNVVSGLLVPQSGTVTFRGKQISEKNPHTIARYGIGRTFQSVRLFPQMSVLENVLLGFQHQSGEGFSAALLKPNGWRRAERELVDRALALLELVGMAHKRDTMGSDLSHGQRRLTEIARALALDPRLLLLDEPMSGLSATAIQQMLVIMRTIREQGRTILFIEHNMHVVMEISEHVVVLNHGQRIAEGTPEQIRGNPAVITAYLGRRGAHAS